MSEPISVNKNFNQCISICLEKGYDNCAERCGEGKDEPDSFLLNPLTYIDPSTRAFKQGIATIANPYSLIGGIGLFTVAEKLEDLWKIKSTPFKLTLGITGICLLAPIALSAYDHYQGVKNKDVSLFKGGVEFLGDVAITGIAHGIGVFAGSIGAEVAISVANTLFSTLFGNNMGFFFLGSAVARLLATFAISYGLTYLMDSTLNSTSP